MAGDEEARARATLVEMQGRISQGALVALGLINGASPEQVRTAFLALTKTFHPARFGRMSIEVQKLSNEVFLGIKSAHDALLKMLGTPPRGGALSTGTLPALPRASSPPPAAPPPAQNQTQKFQPPPARTTPAFGVRVTARPGTPPQASATDPATQRGMGAPAPAPSPSPSPDERLELQRALDLMTAKNWNGARIAMMSLAARVPTSKQYRALLCYTRGREAQVAGKGEDAVMELQRALQFDPELEQAKLALAELLRRR